MDSAKTRPKNRGKSCLFQCFKPDDVVPPRRKAKTTDPLLAYIAVAEKHGTVLPTIVSSALTVAKTVAKGGGEGSRSRQKKIGKDGPLRQALMAALNETSLGKKIIKRRKANKDNIIVNLEGEGDKISNTERKITLGTNSSTSSSHCSSAFTPSSLSYSTSSSSSTSTQASGSSSELYPLRSLLINGIGVMKQQQDIGDNRQGYFGSNVAVCCLFLTSLLVLILCGKFCAILCTSIGFFVVPPRRRRRPCNEEAICGDTEVDSVQYKKKIIMEGLLERSHSHRPV